QILTGSEDRTARLWDLQTGKEIFRLPEHEDSVIDVGFSPDGTTIITGSYLTVRIWDRATGKCLRTHELYEDFGDARQVVHALTCGRFAALCEFNETNFWDENGLTLIATDPALLSYIEKLPRRNTWYGAFRDHIMMLSLELNDKIVSSDGNSPPSVRPYAELITTT
ncbi:MAG: hypothetical protein IT366_21895, partial [Candidatus Hydrogenedentes bacterium]|nr:hypothetical protein [Candidatus Hydrogenedentota bacterium]